MLKPKIGHLVSLLFFLILGMIAFTLVTPTSTQAYPSLGITPTPTPTLTPVPMPTLTPTPDGDSPPDDEVEISVDCICNTETGPLTFSFPVQLIHQGSGWIAEVTVSSAGNAQIAVPYPGTWDVFMTGPPQFDQQTNITLPDNYPVFLGTVQANSGAQAIDCPISCEEFPLPELLPQTGQNGGNSTIFILSGFILLSIIINGLAKFVGEQTVTIKLK